MKELELVALMKHFDVLIRGYQYLSLRVLKVRLFSSFLHVLFYFCYEGRVNEISFACLVPF